MYEGFYHLSDAPFQMTPDARFFFGSKPHSRAVAHLTFGLAQGEGFVIVTGEVGAGKTTLVERLHSQLDRQTYTIVRIGTTRLTGDDLFRLAMAGFGVETAGADKAGMLIQFEAVLQQHAQNKRRCLLIVDEVQNLSLEALEELRMLSNVSGRATASLQTILLGQPQFRRRLASADLDQLRQRVLASYHLDGLGEEETRGYIEHRLTMVGWNGRPTWSDSAFEAIHRHTDGIPRRINRLCSRLLIAGALEECDRITGPMVEEVAGELEQDLRGSRRPQAHSDEFAITPYDRPVLEGGDAYMRRLTERVEALENSHARREHVFQRLLDLLGRRL